MGKVRKVKQEETEDVLELLDCCSSGLVTFAGPFAPFYFHWTTIDRCIQEV